MRRLFVLLIVSRLGHECRLVIVLDWLVIVDAVDNVLLVVISRRVQPSSTLPLSPIAVRVSNRNFSTTTLRNESQRNAR